MFSKDKNQIKTEKHFRQWITLGIRKSSKRKQRLYEKFFKTRTAKSEAEYKTYKNMFEKIKRKSKRNYYSQKILEYKNNTKKHGFIMKEVVDKTNKSRSRLSTKLVINKNEVTSEIGIANKFNKFFTNIGPELAGRIPTASRTFESFLNKIDTTIPADPITINELKEAAFFLKNKEKRRL